jgi:hypothetical protein
MLFDRLKKGWEARLKVLNVSARQFCKQAGISYSTWLQMDNPAIGLCDKIESELAKLESKSNA